MEGVIAVGKGVGGEDGPDDKVDGDEEGLPNGRPSGDSTGLGLRGSPVVLGRGGGERLGSVSRGGAIRR